ncbi:hypothetical protein NDU88_004734 [Pleurodeles waltl]|uniref:Uncharacterized protein n=1 Tax=Pleurodeles waltl TaxID=8319 RepID=A0AAV7WV92_PLEWA|nr:hypothetical protein NDU88_004734 [Pleurodeles waltl]
MTQGTLLCLVGVPSTPVALCGRQLLGSAVKSIPRQLHLLPGIRSIAPQCPGTARNAWGVQESSHPSVEEYSGASRPSAIHAVGPSQTSTPPPGRPDTRVPGLESPPGLDRAAL